MSFCVDKYQVVGRFVKSSFDGAAGTEVRLAWIVERVEVRKERR